MPWLYCDIEYTSVYGYCSYRYISLNVKKISNKQIYEKKKIESHCDTGQMSGVLCFSDLVHLCALINMLCITPITVPVGIVEPFTTSGLVLSRAVCVIGGNILRVSFITPSR